MTYYFILQEPKRAGAYPRCHDAWMAAQRLMGDGQFHVQADVLNTMAAAGISESTARVLLDDARKAGEVLRHAGETPGDRRCRNYSYALPGAAGKACAGECGMYVDERQEFCYSCADVAASLESEHAPAILRALVTAGSDAPLVKFLAGLAAG